MSRAKTAQSKYDGIGSKTTPQTRGASGGLGLPSRVHAIHVVLVRASGPLELAEIKDQLRVWGYDEKTMDVTYQHLESLVNGSESYPQAVVRTDQGYELK